MEEGFSSSRSIGNEFAWGQVSWPRTPSSPTVEPEAFRKARSEGRGRRAHDVRLPRSVSGAADAPAGGLGLRGRERSLAVLEGNGLVLFEKNLWRQVLRAVLEMLQELEQQLCPHFLLPEALRVLFPPGAFLLKLPAKLAQHAVGLAEHLAHPSHPLAKIAGRPQRRLHPLHPAALLLKLRVHIIHVVLDSDQSLAHLLQLRILDLELAVTLADGVRDPGQLRLQCTCLPIEAVLRILQGLGLGDSGAHLGHSQLVLTHRTAPLRCEFLPEVASRCVFTISLLRETADLGAKGRNLLECTRQAVLLILDKSAMLRLLATELRVEVPAVLVHRRLYTLRVLGLLGVNSLTKVLAMLCLEFGPLLGKLAAVLCTGHRKPLHQFFAFPLLVGLRSPLQQRCILIVGE
mmetsp:Transcript_90231/g.254591  ORF Transcript_90231/g.254591 Transcript_90231/m.254591 type:complete len:404 (-) Transcript_90231:323-1534(-)